MSYCVNCGVELAPSEKNCPLCETEVCNPKSPWKEPKSRPYPQQVETILRGVDRRYFGFVAAMLLMIPVSVCFVVDILTAKRITWSGYVIGAAMMIIVIVILPIVSKKHSVYLFILYDTLAFLAYLLLIDGMDSEVTWFSSFGFPIAASAGIIISVMVFLSRRVKNTGLLFAMAMLSFSVGTYTLMIEIFINHYTRAPLMPTWSWYAFTPCLFSGIVFLILNRREKWKEAVRKRLFY